MKNIQIIILSLIVILSATQVAQAESASTSSDPARIKSEPKTMRVDGDDKKEMIREKMEDRKNTIEKNIQEKKERMDIKKDEIKTKIGERKDWLAHKIVNRLNAEVKRLDDLITKIENRIAKIKSTGVDVTNAESKVANAKEHSKAAKTIITSITGQLNEIASSTDPKRPLKSIQADVMKVKKELMDAYESLRAIIGTIKSNDRSMLNRSTTTNN